MTVYVDSSFLIALFHEGDQFHLKAKEIAEEIDTSFSRAVTSNIVIAETINFTFRLKGPEVANRFLSFVRNSGVGEIFLTREIFNDGYRLLFSQKSKRGLNLFDCLHLAAMKHLEIGTILSFDEDFRKEVKVMGI